MTTFTEARSLPVGEATGIRKNAAHLGRTGADFMLLAVLPLALLWAVIVGWSVGNPGASGFWFSVWPLIMMAVIGAVACAAGVLLADRSNLYDPLPKPVRAIGWTLVTLALGMMVMGRVVDGATQQLRLRMDTVGSLLREQFEKSLKEKDARLALMNQQLAQTDQRIAEAEKAGQPTEELRKERAKHATEIESLKAEMVSLKKLVDEVPAKLASAAQQQQEAAAAQAAGREEPKSLPVPEDAEKPAPAAGNPVNPGTPFEPGALPPDPSSDGSSKDEAMMALAGLALAIIFPELIPVIGALFGGLALGTDVKDLPALKGTAERWHQSGQNLDVPTEVARLRAERRSNPKAHVANLLTILNQPHWQKQLGPEKVAELKRELEFLRIVWTDMPQLAHLLGVEGLEQLLRDLPPHLLNSDRTGLSSYVQGNCPPNVHPATWVAVIDNFIDQAASGKGWSLASGSMEPLVLTSAVAAELKKVAREKPEKPAESEKKPEKTNDPPVREEA